jgi:hypothetical protein
MRLRCLNVRAGNARLHRAVSLAHADIYRWTDASGRVN